MDDLSQRIAKLSPEKRALLEKLLQKEGISDPRANGIPRTERLKPTPLSFAQQRLWFVSQLQPDSPFYNLFDLIPFAFPVDAAVLERCLNEIINRHEILRTTFSSSGGEPKQIVAPAQPLSLPVTDLSQFAPDARRAEASRLATAEAQSPFDLTRGPLLRALLLRLQPDEHVLLLTMHHIISDTWSLGVLRQELLTLYEAFAAGQPSPLPELPLQYADYASWQRQHLTGTVLEQQLDYWKRTLAGSPSVLALSADRPRPAAQSFRGASQWLTLPAALTTSLRELARAEGATFFMTLLAAFNALLARYTGQSDIVVGTPVAGRDRLELEALIGFFINTLVLRTDLTGDPSFRALLSRVRAVCVGAYAHSEVPFERVVEELQPERSLSHNPLFQVTFQLFDDSSAMTSQLPDELALPVNAEDAQADSESFDKTYGLEVERRTAIFDLTFDLWEIEGEIRGRVEYATDLFEAETIARMLRHYERLLDSVVADPGQRLSQLALLSEAEREELLDRWNATQIDFPVDKTLDRLFEEQAARTPQAVAVISEQECLTYAELNWRANQLARHLRRCGVGPEAMVGVLMERSADLVVALLAILKAGAAYVPLDPTYPAARLRFMVENADADRLLTQGELAGSLSGYRGNVLRLDDAWQALADESGDNLPGGAQAENAAYVIYTSGSTGQPKGVIISHRAICNHMLWMQEALPLTEADAVLQKTPISFDASVWEFYAPLLAGARLVMARPGGHKDSAYLVEAIKRFEITTLQLVPSLLQMLLEEPRLPECRSLRRVYCGGEALSLALQNRFFARLDAALINLYGPTEATIDATYYLCERASERQFVPLGHPIANTQTYILDEHFNPVPVGVTGELYLGGAGLARGYLGQPGLTAAAFLPDPFASRPGSRLYRTGDLARFRSDGTIEFLGRRDQQVKLRGVRIEIEEIEATLRQHPAINAAAVIVREDVPGDQRLVAYVTLNARQQDEQLPPTENAAVAFDHELASQLRSYLKERLPEQMLPSAFVRLTGLPLNESGKLDRRALPAVATDDIQAERGLSAPRTPIEEILTSIWGDVLRLPHLGLHDNFFELGGHSLLGMQIIARAREAFRVEIPLRTLFEQPTLAAMASVIEAALRGSSAPATPRLLPAARDAELPLSFAQQRLWFLDQLVPGNPFYNVDTALRLSMDLQVDVLRECLDQIVARHEALRTTFQVVDGQPTQVIAPELKVHLPVTDLRSWPEDERESEATRLAHAEAQRPFNLAEGPLLRAALLRLGDEDYLLLLTLHHIVTDGWSMGLLFGELSALYTALTTGAPPQLPELPLQYADYAVWQRGWLQGEMLEQQIQYWKQNLADVPRLQLPTDYARPALATYRGARCRFMLPAALTASLSELARAEGATLFMTLLAAFNALLTRYTGQSDIVVGTPVAGRDRLELEALIGFFVNTLVLRTDLTGDPSFRALLSRVRAVCVGAYAHAEVPFERVVEELQPERSLSYNPLFQVTFQLFSALASAQSETEEDHSLLPVERGTAIFDLAFTLWENQEGLGGQVEYSTELFKAETIERLIRHYNTLLESISADPQRRLSELSLSDAAERHRLLVEQNDTQADYPAQCCFHELFEQQSANTPDAVALVSDDGALSYRELNRRANQLARYLRRLEVTPEARVAVLLGRSPEMIVAFLAVLKAGATYLPLDTASPPERLRFMAQDAGAEVVLTWRRFAESLSASGIHFLYLDEAWETIAHEAAENLPCQSFPENLAYVIYTSGSTGQPKGVGVAHRSLINLAAWHQRVYEVTPADRAALLATPAFDASVWEICPYLCTGASIYIPSEAIRESLPELLQYLNEQAISICFLPTPLAEIALAEPQVLRLPLRTLLTGGDKLRRWPPPELPFRLANNYGPTESTVVATWGWVDRAATEAALPPIGGPVANTQLYLLDQALQPVPVGAVGEIYLGGHSLARGYLNRPELTAEKFIPHPFSVEPGARLYRTGDRARRLSDGQIEFLGRADEQVKVRGFRIELGEIEAVLGQHELVQEALVVAREDQAGEKQLVAYVVPQGEAQRAPAQAAELQAQQVSQWQSLYEETYSQATPVTDPAFNIIGWNSSYTGAPIPAAEMREWQGSTVERIRSLQPRRVLEIGCGTGLLLFQLAPACESYWGTDFSRASLDYVREQWDARAPESSHLKLLQRRADDFSGLAEGSFDTVILNSVVQYFPSLDYFLEVLEGAIRVLRPGGRIFLGDLRNLRLLEAFHASVQLAQAAPLLDTETLRQRLWKNAALEEELLLDPALFAALKHRFPRLGQVQVQLKRGAQANELTCFRYDVVLWLDTPTAARPPGARLDWETEQLTPSELRRRLAQQQPLSLEVRNVPNARVLASVETLKMLWAQNGPLTAGELQEALSPLTKSSIDPEEIWALGESLPYDINICWSATHEAAFDVTCQRRADNNGARPASRFFSGLAESSTMPNNLHSYANDPLAGMLARRLAPRLRDYLKERLPEFMIPAALVVLSEFPLTAHGKLDKRALPAPDQARSGLRGHYVAPRTGVEESLSRIWMEVLGMEKISVNDDFFELGGHSLLATKIVSRIHSTFQVDLPLRSLFETPTIAGLARAVTQAQGSDGLNAVPLTRVAREQYLLKDPSAKPKPTETATTGVRLDKTS